MLNISEIIGKFIKNSSQRDIDKLKSTVEKINSVGHQGILVRAETKILQTFI